VCYAIGCSPTCEEEKSIYGIQLGEQEECYIQELLGLFPVVALSMTRDIRDNGISKVVEAFGIM